MPLPRMPRSRIQPKQRSMPRQQTEAATYLEMHKISIERQRLLEELVNLRQRYAQVTTRLHEIDDQLAGFDRTAEGYRSQRSQPPALTNAQDSTRILLGQEVLTRPVQGAARQSVRPPLNSPLDNGKFDSFTLEY